MSFFKCIDDKWAICYNEKLLSIIYFCIIIIVMYFRLHNNCTITMVNYIIYTLDVRQERKFSDFKQFKARM